MKVPGWRIPAVLVLVIALLSPLLAAPRAAFACSCAYAPIPNELRFNDTVFSGKVLRVGDGPKGGDSSALREIVVAVDHVWLGIVPQQATVTTALGGASCGYESFAVGQRFLIYARSSGETFETNLCSPTRPYDDAAVKLLEGVTGPGVRVEPMGAAIGPETDTEPAAAAIGSETQADSRPWLPIAAWSAGAMAVAALGAAMAIRWRRKA